MPLMCHLKTAIKQLTTIFIRSTLFTLIYTYCIGTPPVKYETRFERPKNVQVNYLVTVRYVNK